VSQDYAKARDWFKKSAALGNADAMYMLGELYYYGNGVPRDYAKASECCNKSAALGNSNAMLKFVCNGQVSSLCKS
jgi:uncharacterized protein